jgi:hypothetical protein
MIAPLSRKRAERAAISAQGRAEPDHIDTDAVLRQPERIMVTWGLLSATGRLPSMLKHTGRLFGLWEMFVTGFGPTKPWPQAWMNHGAG